MTFELTLLALSVIVLFVHITAQSGLLTRDLGSAYNAGPRDESRQLSPMGGRAERALRNFLETWPAFIALALIVAVTDQSGWMTQWGAGIYIASRLAYLPLYLFGVPYIRSAVFGVACLGLLLMLIGVLV